MPDKGAQARNYRATELRALMDATGARANSWDDVLGYLRGGDRDAGIPHDAARDMMQDVESLQRDEVRFTRDYRKMWQKLTGEDAAKLPPPRHLDPCDLDPLELQDDYLQSLEFPCTRKDVIRAARQNNAPGRVIDRLEEIPDRQYDDRDALLEELEDADWHTEQ